LAHAGPPPMSSSRGFAAKASGVLGLAAPCTQRRRLRRCERPPWQKRVCGRNGVTDQETHTSTSTLRSRGTPTRRARCLHESPRAAENFRAMCTGEKGGRLTYKGMRFYRILDMFIDQAGVHGVSSIWGEAFDDDPGGLLLKHDRPGLLSAANSGPDTNSGHFSIVVAPAPHLDTSYTIFGEVVQGMDIVMAVNALAPPSGASLGSAVVTAAGCLKNCDPRPQVTAKCKTRAHEERLVQGRSIHPCLD